MTPHELDGLTVGRTQAEALAEIVDLRQQIAERFATILGAGLTHEFEQGVQTTPNLGS